MYSLNGYIYLVHKVQKMMTAENVYKCQSLNKISKPYPYVKETAYQQGL